MSRDYPQNPADKCISPIIIIKTVSEHRIFLQVHHALTASEQRTGYRKILDGFFMCTPINLIFSLYGFTNSINFKIGF